MTFLRLLLGYLLQVLPFAVLSFYPFLNQMRFSKRKSGLLTSALILGLALIFAGTGCWLQRVLPPNQTLFTTVNIVFMLALLPCLLWYLYAVKAVWQKKLFVFSFALSGALIITSVSNTICTWLYLNVGQSDGLPYRGFTPLILFLMTVVFLPAMSLILKCFYRPVEDSFTQKEGIYLSALSIVLFAVVSSGLSYINYNNLYNPMSLFLYIALLVAIFFIYAIYFKMLRISHEKLTTQRNYDEAQRQLVLQEEQYRRLTENMEITRRMRHDLRHHMVTVQGFLKNGETAQAERYLSQTLKIAEEHEIVKLCNNAVVNLIVTHSKTLAKERGIQFSARIIIPDNLPILDVDLSVVIGNLLENAVDAAEQVIEEVPFIHFNMICSGKMLAITVDNSFGGIVRINGGKYLSTKENHTGYGLESVEAIAERYSGGVEFTHEGKVFHSSVMMGLHPPKVNSL